MSVPEQVEDLPIGATIFGPLSDSLAEKKFSQVLALAGMVGCIILSLTLFYVLRGSRVEVHVIETDRLGKATYVGTATPSGEYEDTVVRAELAAFVRQVRTFFDDRDATHALRLEGFAHLTESSRSYLERFEEENRDSPDALGRRLNKRVIDVESVARLGESRSYQIRFVQTDTGRVTAATERSRWVAIAEVALIPVRSASREDVGQLLERNPLGLFILSLDLTRESIEEVER